MERAREKCNKIFIEFWCKFWFQRAGKNNILSSDHNKPMWPLNLFDSTSLEKKIFAILHGNFQCKHRNFHLVVASCQIFFNVSPLNSHDKNHFNEPSFPTIQNEHFNLSSCLRVLIRFRILNNNHEYNFWNASIEEL